MSLHDRRSDLPLMSHVVHDQKGSGITRETPGIGYDVSFDILFVQKYSSLLYFCRSYLWHAWQTTHFFATAKIKMNSLLIHEVPFSSYSKMPSCWEHLQDKVSKMTTKTFESSTILDMFLMCYSKRSFSMEKALSESNMSAPVCLTESLAAAGSATISISSLFLNFLTMSSA